MALSKEKNIKENIKIDKNNNLKNLELLSMQDNRRHAVELGLFESGCNRFNSKLKIEDVFYILENKGIKSTSELGKMFNLDQSNIVRIHQGKNYKKEKAIWEEIKNQSTGK